MDFVAPRTSKNKSYSVVFEKKTKSFQRITLRLAQLGAIKSSSPYGCKYLSDCTGLSVLTQTRHFYAMLKRESTGLSARYTLSFITSVRAAFN